MIYRSNKLSNKEIDIDEAAKLIYDYGQEVKNLNISDVIKTVCDKCGTEVTNMKPICSKCGFNCMSGE